jgi:general secretion pathway protein K
MFRRIRLFKRSATGKKPAHKLRLRASKRGVALIMVLGALTILTVMLTEVQDESSAEFSSALSARDALIAEYAAKSAVNLSRLLIAAEPTIRQGLGPLAALVNNAQIPVWNYADMVLGAFNDTSGAEAFAGLAGVDVKQGKNLGFEGGGFEIKIVDEDSKINVNQPARGSAFANAQLSSQLIGLLSGPQYSPLFDSRDSDGNFSDRQAVCSAIVDWGDPDQDQYVCDPHSSTAQQTAAEDSYYELLKRPYARKNAAFDSMEELRMVRGVGDDFWATFVDPDPDKPEKRVMTVWGQGVINVNTANAQTLWALICAHAIENTPLCVDVNESSKFLISLNMMKSFMPGIPLFGSAGAFVNAIQASSAPTTPGQTGTTPAAPAASPLGGLPGLGGGSPLAGLGLQPVQLRSASELKKQVGVESKIFSMYATGVVKSGKRETRVRVHAVVDYRSAPTVQDMMNRLMAAATQGSASTNPTTPAPNAAQGSSATGAQPNAISGSLQPTPAGNIIYYRID